LLWVEFSLYIIDRWTHTVMPNGDDL